MATFEGRFTDATGLRIAVVVARFNDLVTSKLLSGCLDCLSRHGVDASPTSSQLDVAWVPGSFELPLVAQRLAVVVRAKVAQAGLEGELEDGALPLARLGDEHTARVGEVVAQLEQLEHPRLHRPHIAKADGLAHL